MKPRESPLPTEPEKVEAWRLHSLLDAGFSVADAERLAVRGDVDLHQAVELLKRGCLPATAVAILT